MKNISIIYFLIRKFLINEIVKKVPNKFKAWISFGLGEIDSLFFFYNMIERGDISIEDIKDDGQKTQINVLKTYIFCKKNNLDTKIFTLTYLKYFRKKNLTLLINILKTAYDLCYNMRNKCKRESENGKIIRKNS